MFGLNAGGSYETKQINLDYFIDPSILNNKKARHSDIFLTEIIIKSNELGVKINTDKII